MASKNKENFRDESHLFEGAHRQAEGHGVREGATGFGRCSSWKPQREASVKGMGLQVKRGGEVDVWVQDFDCEGESGAKAGVGAKYSTN